MVWKRGVCLIWTLCKLFTLIPCLWCTLPWSLIYCEPCLINGGSCNQSTHALCVGCSHLAASCHPRHQWRDVLECMAADHRLQPAQLGCEEFWRLPNIYNLKRGTFLTYYLRTLSFALDFCNKNHPMSIIKRVSLVNGSLFSWWFKGKTGIFHLFQVYTYIIYQYTHSIQPEAWYFPPILLTK